MSYRFINHAALREAEVDEFLRTLRSEAESQAAGLLAGVLLYSLAQEKIAIMEAERTQAQAQHDEQGSAIEAARAENEKAGEEVTRLKEQIFKGPSDFAEMIVWKTALQEKISQAEHRQNETRSHLQDLVEARRPCSERLDFLDQVLEQLRSVELPTCPEALRAWLLLDKK